ncbi:MAG: hypothetical protein IMZ52_02355 [Actinobacteria bacterium]|nr:hypothetical protein [Actinomycetota bacterium]MBE3114865.1 hypothetical protein [Actinomycetota bacterium]
MIDKETLKRIEKNNKRIDKEIEREVLTMTHEEEMTRTAKNVNKHFSKKKQHEKDEYWLIPPSRCKYAQQFDIEVDIDGIKGTCFGCICLIRNHKENPLYFYKCCEKNCPKMNELEKIMFKRDD